LHKGASLHHPWPVSGGGGAAAGGVGGAPVTVVALRALAGWSKRRREIPSRRIIDWDRVTLPCHTVHRIARTPSFWVPKLPSRQPGCSG